MPGDASDSASDAHSAAPQYPTEASAYELLEEIGHGISATVSDSSAARASSIVSRDASTTRRRAGRRH